MTLAELRSFLRLIVDEPTAVKWSNTNLNTMLNRAYNEIVQEVVRRNPKYFHTSATVTSTASTPYTDIPSDCILINKLVNSDKETLYRLDTTQMDMSESSGEPTHFDVVGQHIFWWPEPDAAYAYTAYYHNMPTDMSADTSVPQLPVGYHDIIAFGAAINIRTAKEEKIQEYMVKYEKKLQLLLHTVMIDQTNESPRVKGAYHEFYIYN